MPTDRERDGFAWREAGSHIGPVVVALHGLGGTRISFEPQLDALSTSARVLAWDMPGYGASAPLEGPTTFAELAGAVAGFLDAAGVARAHLVGLSLGGMIAQYAAASFPERFDSLTLLSTSPKFGLDGTRPDHWLAARLAPLDQGLEPRDFAERVLRSLAGPGLDPLALQQQIEAMARITSAGLRRAVACLVTHDSRSFLPRITAPTRVLVGSLDTETPPSYAQAIVGGIAGARLDVIAGVGHLLNVEAPAAVNRIIAEQLAR